MLRLGFRSDEAEDAAQDIMLITVRGLRPDATVEEHTAFAVKCAYNKAHWRKPSRLTVSIDDVDVVDGHIDPEQWLIKTGLRDAVIKAVLRLSRLDRLALFYRLQGLKSREIAPKLGGYATENSVNVRMAEALRKLRKQLISPKSQTR